MYKIEVVTNNVPRDVIDGWQLTESEREQFDYMNWDGIIKGNDSALFFRYRGELYDIADIPRLYGGGGEHFRGWDGAASDSHFSGMLFRWARDENGDLDLERCVVGRYFQVGW